MNCSELIFTGHALTKMFARGIPPEEVRGVLGDGETIAEYPDDKPHPSRLLLGTVHGRVLHVVVARDDATQRCYVITVYEPEHTKWSPDFKRRTR
ncbi:MAG: DUF4258 domain-containing protein [Deltaproteobacteria bacterium]|nr:DUF4258 domain-containing protein [Deltaproteobacteria bacterium]